ncbi:YjaG family protein [Marinospirillum minutulum]|uniref:YjaG family protein n=1 Tax=Marinospirillum minutulum TaxID=64974 RepID=UPI0004214197|nr:YjaG family protein [Marinospirillum minutulum]
MTATKPLSFNQRLRSLSPWQQWVFITALAQRSALNYQLFCEAVDFGDAGALNKLLGLLWESQLSKEAKVNWAVQQEKLAELQPDPDAYEIYGVYPALDAAMAVELAIEQALQPDEENTIRASKLSRSTVRQFLIKQLPETFDEEQESAWLRVQPLMDDENAFQDALLAQVTSANLPHPVLIRQLRELAYNQGFSNLGIGLD